MVIFRVREDEDTTYVDITFGGGSSQTSEEVAYDLAVADFDSSKRGALASARQCNHAGAWINYDHMVKLLRRVESSSQHQPIETLNRELAETSNFIIERCGVQNPQRGAA